MAEMTTLDRVACAISGAPFPTASSLRKARAALTVLRDVTPEMDAAMQAAEGDTLASACTLSRVRLFRAGIDATLGKGEQKS